MKSYRQLPIRMKLTIIILATSAFGLVASSLAYVLNDHFASQKTLRYVVETQGDMVAANLTAALTFGNRADAREILATLSTQSHVLGGSVYDAKGQLFARYAPDQRVRPFPSEFTALERREPVSGRLMIVRPVVLERDTLGRVVLIADGKALSAHIGSVTGIVLATLVALLIVALLVASRAHRAVSGPIAHLVEITRRVSNLRDYTLRAKPQGDGEMMELIDGINEMLKQIQSRDRKLEEHARTLEKEVSDRTDELRLLTDQYRHRAYHDELTGLPNRALFEDRLRQQLEHSRGREQVHAVLFLDLDRFKVINDTLGHWVGDELLKVIGQRVRDGVRDVDTVSRLGGDEFTVLLSDIGGVESVTRLVQQIIVDVREPVEVGVHRLHVSTSIGVSLYPNDATEASDLMRFADAAMYRAKEDGRNAYRFYTEDMHKRAMRRVQLEAALHKGLRAREFELHYQPRFNLRTGQLVGVEALLRWHSPDYGEVPPAEFIPVAEESGLIFELGEWVLHTACRQFSSWKRMGLEDGRVSVNVSVRQLKQPGIADIIWDVLDSCDLSPSDLELELTESAFVDDPVEMARLLSDVRRLGVVLAVDDFGTGYSSLNYLRQLPLDVLKIDRDFVQGLNASGEGNEIIKAIILLARSLKLTVVAEGVETEEEAHQLRELGCELVQGFYYSRPARAEQVRDLIVEHIRKAPGS